MNRTMTYATSPAKASDRRRRASPIKYTAEPVYAAGGPGVPGAPCGPNGA